MFRATLCPSSGTDDLVVFFHVYVARATYLPMDTQAANRIWLPTQTQHYTTRKKIPLSRQILKMGTRWPETCWATYKEQLIRRNKYNTKWHLVGFLFHTKVVFEGVQVLLFDTDSKTGCRTSRILKLPNIVYSNVGLQCAKFSSVIKI